MSDVTQTRPAEASFGDYFALLKPKVMSLVVFTAFVGLMCAPVALHPLEAFCAVLFMHLGRCCRRVEHVVGRRYRRNHAPHAKAAGPSG